MSYDAKSQAPTSAPLREHRPQGAPGKRQPTDSLPGRTGVPVIDDGTTCERADNAGDCFLDKDDRTRFIGLIINRAGVVGNRAYAAISDKRTDVFLAKPEGWNALAEFAFYGVTGWMIGGVLTIIKTTQYANKVEHISAVLTNASRAYRKVLQGGAVANTSHAQHSKARFLELLAEGIGLWQIQLAEEAVALLDDAGLVALKDALDPAIHTIDAFKGKLDDMLARFDRQEIDQTGVTGLYRQGELMWIGRGKRRRLVLLEDHGFRHAPQTGGDVKPRDLVQKTDGNGKPIIIDRDLEAMTLALYAERTGREPAEMDAEAAVAKGGALAKVASELILDVLMLGSAP